MMHKPLSEQLKAIRKEYGWTLRYVADQAGISVSFLSDLEHGRSSPSLATIERLTDVYGPVFDYPMGNAWGADNKPVIEWAIERPAEPGWYWYRSGGFVMTAQVWRSIEPGKLLARRCGQRGSYDIEQFGGEWAGPIEPPE
jgi:transcriptional regulator with XRE-family HTH domain